MNGTSIILDWSWNQPSFPTVRATCTCGWGRKISDYGDNDPAQEYDVLIHKALCHDGTVTVDIPSAPLVLFVCETDRCERKFWTREWVGWGDTAEATCDRCGEEVSTEIPSSHPAA